MTAPLTVRLVPAVYSVEADTWTRLPDHAFELPYDVNRYDVDPDYSLEWSAAAIEHCQQHGWSGADFYGMEGDPARLDGWIDARTVEDWQGAAATPLPITIEAIVDQAGPRWREELRAIRATLPKLGTPQDVEAWKAARHAHVTWQGRTLVDGEHLGIDHDEEPRMVPGTGEPLRAYEAAHEIDQWLLGD